VTKYTYNDIIEAYVVSSDENGNFFQIDFSPNFGDSHQVTIGFSVPVDATNLYVDYRLGNKVYKIAQSIY
jgi:hypothetical protein